jgi:hypothetical protein
MNYEHAYLLLVEHLRALSLLASRDHSPAILQSRVLGAWKEVQRLEAEDAADWDKRHVFTATRDLAQLNTDYRAALSGAMPNPICQHNEE